MLMGICSQDAVQGNMFDTVDRKKHQRLIAALDGINERHGRNTLKWGLIPALTKSESDAKKISEMCLNARTETVFNLPSFYNPVLTKRCLIPATGYFEFHHRDGNSIPYYIFLKDEIIFPFCGLYEIWKSKEAENETINTFTILTVPANSLCTKIYNGGKNSGRIIW